MYELMDRDDDAIADHNALEQELKDTYAPSAWDVATARNTKGTFGHEGIPEGARLGRDVNAYAQIAIIKRNETQLTRHMLCQQGCQSATLPT